MLFVAERPYLPAGTLRELLACGASTDAASERGAADASITETLDALGLATLAERASGLDVERDWEHVLPLDQQQLLCVARLVLARPRFVFLERLDATLGDQQIERVLALLGRRNVGWVMLGGGAEPSSADWALDLAESGAWTWTPRAA